jgi:hypothetical protein
MTRVRSPAGEVLTPRARRVRDSYLRRWAVGRGMPAPSVEELGCLGGEVSLGEAVAWWEGRHPPAAVSESTAPGGFSRSRGRVVVVRLVVGIAVALLGLAVTPGRLV